MTTAAPPLDRARMLAEIAARPDFDVVVIGGGITGAGTFRDLALQGLRVLLVERSDFASGASGALTRIAHGGFRYLERGDIALVRDSVIERDRLLANAPHAVKPIRVVLPLSARLKALVTAPLGFLRLAKTSGLPGTLAMRLAGLLYDGLAPRPRALPRTRLVARAGFPPRLRPLAPRYRALLTMGEGRIHMPERVAVELVEDGVVAGSGSVALNHCPLVEADGGRLTIEDRLGGTLHVVTARAVVNAAGAHADAVAALFGPAEPMTGGVAGIHLLVDAPEAAAALGDDLLFFEDAARRRLCVTYQIAPGRLLLGTTEAPVADPDAASATPDDEAYLLAALAAALPDLPPPSVVERIVGVRPLLRSSDAQLSARSRDHAVLTRAIGEATLVTVIGGKWTTFRRMAADAADAVLSALGRSRAIDTAALPIGGGRNYPRSDAERTAAEAALVATGVGPRLAARLVETYGSRAPRVAASILAHGADAISDDGRLTHGEVVFFAREEMAATADDIIRRRTDQFFTTADRAALARRIDGMLKA